MDGLKKSVSTTFGGSLVSLIELSAVAASSVGTLTCVTKVKTTIINHTLLVTSTLLALKLLL